MSAADRAARRGGEKALQEVAEQVLGILALQDPHARLVFGNRLIEEASLLGGPKADLAEDFGERIGRQAIEEINRAHGPRSEG